ncbi:MAG: hypothetical protein HY899_18300 [Deltaproteobacteria bacterium]|nr:hypothetical protein [Deltaproteobacteria bacterium]
MAKPNYAFAKRQRDLAKKAKKEEKRLRKAAGGDETDATAGEGTAPEGAAPDQSEQTPAESPSEPAGDE